ncbi:MAG: lysylphosphatidylglycerol synthase domain-containing protein, partial [Acidimicrobiia bacterium]
MTVRHALRTRSQHGWLAVAIGIATAATIAIVVRSVDGASLRLAAREIFASPWLLAGALVMFAGAFAVRAEIWRRVLPGLGFWQAWAAIHVTLAGNHLLPLRLGEPLRVVSVARRANVTTAEAAASTLALRAADILIVVALAVVLGAGSLPFFGAAATSVIVGGSLAVGGAGVFWLRRLRAAGRIRMPGPAAIAGSALAWVLEAGIVFAAARAAGLPLTFTEAVFVSVVSVAAQVAAFAPGGFGTYEAGAVAAYASLGHDPGTALAAALVAHALKTAYSLVVGAFAAVAPSPGIVGRLRLPRRLPERPSGRPIGHEQPVVLFMPAFNEEEIVAATVERTPSVVHGHSVVVLVVDDGSVDGTASEARAAGADVVSLGANRGLGAAVRIGVAKALEFDPAAVVFCDADGEYAPEELAILTEPILRGEADYVVGSRFGGNIERMLPHRRLGNRVLSGMLSLIARRRVSDGQSGYRAFSAPAAESAEIIHDYNYAQVLTLDLLAKGYRYAEVPIRYSFRTTGSSFIRLGTYLRHVIPAV